MMNHLLLKPKILCDNQHGFRKYCSCESQLMALTHKLSKSMDEAGQTNLIFLDFAKAFDKVNHSSLMKKIFHYGIRDNLHGLIRRGVKGPGRRKEEKPATLWPAQSRPRKKKRREGQKKRRKAREKVRRREWHKSSLFLWHPDCQRTRSWGSCKRTKKT